MVHAAAHRHRCPSRPAATPTCCRGGGRVGAARPPAAAFASAPAGTVALRLRVVTVPGFSRALTLPIRPTQLRE